VEARASGSAEARAWSSQEEALLVDRLRAGDHAAFEELVNRATGRMLAVARRFLPEEQDAMDAVQDAFISAYKNMGKFQAGSQLTTWLHRIVVNACLMKLRSRKRRPEKSIEDFLPTYDGTGHRMSGVAAWPEAGERLDPDRAETRSKVREAIEQLPEDYRNVILLRDIEGMDTDESAVVLGISAGAVKTRLHRARQALREVLDLFVRGMDEP